MEAFITGRSVISSSGAFAAPTPAAARASAGPGPGGGGEDGDTRDIVLAERTSQLVSSYRDYVAKKGDEETPAGRICGAGNGDGDAASRSGSLRDRSTSSTHNPLLREWGSSREDPYDLEMEEDDWQYTGDDDCYVHGKKRRYSHGIYRSGKFKRLLITVLAVGGVVAITMAVVQSSRQSRLPDWNEELKEELLEEQAASRLGLPHFPVREESEVAVEDAPVVEEEPEEEIESMAAARLEGKEEAKEDEDEEEAGEEDEEEAAESLKEEDVREEGDTILTGAALEAITRHILCCSSASSPYSRALTATNEASANAGNVVAAEYARAEALRPTWYVRSDGWQGRSYQDALLFCAGRREDDGGGMQLCPYEAYCPTGPYHLPMGGIRVEENEEGGKTAAYSARAPVGDRPDRWVQVGSLNVCVQYDILDTDDGAQVKKEVKKEVESIITGVLNDEKGDQDLASAASASEAAALTKDSVEKQVGLVKETYAPVAKTRPAAMVEGAITQMEKNPNASKTPKAPHQLHDQQLASLDQKQAVPLSPQTAAINAATASSPARHPQSDIEALLRQKFKPLWLSAGEGWNGGSHDDAVQFCHSIRGKALCPYSAMCPHGPGRGVMGGRHEVELVVAGEQYAPVAGERNHWVLIGGGRGAEKKCRTHRQLKGTAPVWGLTGDRAEVKEHVMCCTVD